MDNKKQIIRYIVVFSVLAILFFVAFVMNINTGSVNISVREIFEIVIKRSMAQTKNYSIIWKIRLPRMLTAAVLGGALALSGFLLQTFFRNPIAGPYVLGISSGAKMFLAFVTVVFANTKFGMPVYVSIITAFIGSMISMVFVLLFAGYVRNMSVLLVIGIMVSNICTAITDFIIDFANEADIVNLTHWSLGSFSGASWVNLKIAAIIVFISLVGSFLASKPMQAYLLSEEYALSMGVNIKLFRFVLIFLSSILSACVIAFAGPIAFVGIAVPHITKLMLNTAKPIIIIPAVFMCGSVFCMFCDLAARTLLSPTEISLGTITSLIGAPIVISLMLRQRRER